MADIVSARDLRSGYRLVDLEFGYLPLLIWSKFAIFSSGPPVLGRYRFEGFTSMASSGFYLVGNMFISRARHLSK